MDFFDSRETEGHFFERERECTGGSTAVLYKYFCVFFRIFLEIILAILLILGYNVSAWALPMTLSHHTPGIVHPCA